MMDFSYSDEQKMLQESVTRFITDHYSPEARDALIEGEDGFSREHWQAYGDLGWLAVGFDEDDGGLGGGIEEVMIIMQGLGRGLALEPYLASVVLGGGLIARAGAADMRALYLPELMGGQMRLAFAHAESQARFDLSDVATRAVADGPDWIISGQKIAVLHGASADHLIVSARSEGSGISLFVVPRQAPGLHRRDYRTLDEQRASNLTFEGVRVPASAMLGGPGTALPVIERVVDAAIVALCADAVGAMQAACDLTRAYLQDRQQFGTPLGKFQVLQHRLVDMVMEHERAQSLTMMAAVKLNGADEDRARIVSATKARVGRAAAFVAKQSMQLHGGMALTDEYPIGRYFKRLTVFNTLFGSPDFHLRRFADLSDTPVKEDQP